MTFGDLTRRAMWALHVRPGRAALSALGVAVGVGAVVGVLGVSSTIQGGLLAQLNTLGDVMSVTGGSGSGVAVLVPPRVLAMVQRIPTVQGVAGTRTLPGSVQRSQLISGQSGISIVAFEGNLSSATGTHIVAGRSISSAWDLPDALIGSEAANALGVTRRLLPMQVWAGTQSVTVVGILSATPVDTPGDLSLFVPAAYAHRALGFGYRLDTIYVRAPVAYSAEVSSLLLPTIDPSGSLGLQVQQDSSTLLASAEAATAFQGLFLGLAVVAVLVAAIGVMNTLLVAVVERRAEIGVRRAMGATRFEIAGMLIAEALMIAVAGSVVGLLFGFWVTIGGALHEGVPPVLPALVALLGVGVALAIACLASLYPALRAARLPPSEALRTIV
ncbi:MAG TPA: ABC transporter permease [Candidatus Dormibacteraeota bacterium]|nr:ABC transporter permease [Candidatus Dormibacteraeota bacterium]